MAAALVAEGAVVTICGRTPDTLQRTAAELGVHAVVADTGRDESVRALVAAVGAALGGVDILVNAAAKPGGQARPPTLAEITYDAFWADVNVKVLGYLRCAREVAPRHDRAAAGVGSSTSAGLPRARPARPSAPSATSRSPR